MMTKLSISLKTYIALTFTVIGLLIVIGYSLLSYNFFFRGMDNIISANMEETIYRYLSHRPEPLPQTIQDYYLTSSWEDQPEEIKNIYKTSPKQRGKLYVYKDRPQFFRPNKIYFLLILEIEGEDYFISRVGPPKFRSSLVAENHHRSQNLLYLISIVSFLFLLLIIWLLIRKISQPINNLNTWTNNLTSENLNDSPPDFIYPELNQQAMLIQNSLKSVNETLQREQQFLRFTSHELRTPISVIRNNIQLAHKLNSLSISEGVNKHVELIDRIDRASLTMQHLTETLLWLSRNDVEALPTQATELDSLIRTITDELRYLLNDKPVEIMLSLSTYKIELPTAATRIILGNLIRNAFQHTWQGIVIIEQQQNHVCIINHCEHFASDNKTDDLGFGLGLRLTHELCKKLDWQYANQIIADGHKVQLTIKADSKSNIDKTV